MKSSFAVLFVVPLILGSVLLDVANTESIIPYASSVAPAQSPEASSYCPAKCTHRCSRNPRGLCMKLCMVCCSKCNCVPTGPYSDKKECPCYRDMVNKKGQPKCP